MEMDRNSATRLHRQLADQVRERIISGDLPPGCQLPSEAELGEEYGVGRNTVRQALAVLRTEGLLRTAQGSGTFVADPTGTPMTWRGTEAFSRSARLAATDTAGFQRELKALGRIGSVSLEVEQIAAPADIAERLDIPPGSNVVVRHRLQRIEGNLSALADSYFPLALVAGTEVAGEAKVRGGTDRAMADLGYEAVVRRDEITARMPTPEEAQELRIAGGVPVVLVVGTEITAEGLPVEVYSLVLPADRHRLVYEVRKDT